MRKTKTKHAAKKQVLRQRRYTPREQQLINDLADMLGKLLPATSQGPFSLQSIAKQKGLAKFFPVKLSKKKQFVYFITKVHGKHPRTLKRIINDVLADAVERRRTQGNPVLRAEADAFKEKLSAFGINLTHEIEELNFDVTRPKITPPPIVIQQSVERLGIHPLLLSQVLPLFKDGYVNEAVRKAGEIFETEIMRWSGVRGRTGRGLMSHVFDKDNPIIDIALYHGSEILNPVDEREGFMLTAMGAMHWRKNTLGHAVVDQLPPHEGASRIIFLSHLLEVVDSVMKRKASQSDAVEVMTAQSSSLP